MPNKHVITQRHLVQGIFVVRKLCQAIFVHADVPGTVNSSFLMDV